MAAEVIRSKSRQSSSLCRDQAVWPAVLLRPELLLWVSGKSQRSRGVTAQLATMREAEVLASADSGARVERAKDQLL